jgi:signal transduction histidine kinase
VTLPLADPAVSLLVVDDDARFADHLRVLLSRTRTRFEVSVVGTVQETLRLLAAGTPDACLLDCRLGSEDGLDVLRGDDTRGLRTPILLIGDEDESLELCAIELGAEEYLSRSELEPRRLERTLLRAMARRRTERALRQREKDLQEQLRQAQKMEAVGRLAGGVAHDFNNLLTAILGYVEFLKEECAGIPGAERDLDEVRNAATSASALTAQLLAFSRKQVLKPEVLCPNQALEGMRSLLARIAGEDVTLAITFGEHVPLVEADLVQLQQVLINLAANARDAMPQGGRLLIETSDLTIRDNEGGRSLPAGRYASIVVSDTGCGMDRDTLAHAFEPFFTTKAPGMGTGLGLASVYGIVKQSGGDIACESSPGAGTTFSILLPASEKARRPPAGRETPRRRGDGTILLVEDRADVRKLARRILESRGYRVLDTDDPEVASRVTEETSVDLLLTDLVMPQVTGPELARRIRVRHPAMPVLFMTGFTDHQSVADMGGAPFLQKPFTPEGLAEGVATVLEGARGQRRVS